MNIHDAIRNRRSVRHYSSVALNREIVDQLQSLVDEYNTESGLHIQLITNEPRSFGESVLARYGKFSGVTNYFAMVGPKSEQLDEIIGYYGEKLVLESQMLGLNTCWVGLSYKKIGTVIDIAMGEKLVCVISVGIGTTQGVDHKRKKASQVSTTPIQEAPQWYRQGIEAALLAPTAINQQKFKFTLYDNNQVSVKAGMGFFSRVDLGIVKLHFEIGAGVENFSWK